MDLLHKDLEKIILHVGTNNATTDTPSEIFEKLSSLKEEIKGKLPNCTVIISNLIKKNR